MSEENNAPETAAEPTETSQAAETQTGNEATEAQELTIPSNWEQPVQEFFKSDVFKKYGTPEKVASMRSISCSSFEASILSSLLASTTAIGSTNIVAPDEDVSCISPFMSFLHSALTGIT